MSYDPLYIAFEKFKSRLLNLTNRLLQNEEDASDAVQETFCRLWPHKERIRTEQEAAALSIRTARNICIDKLRHDNRIQFDDYTDAAPDSFVPSVHDEMERRETFELIRRIIEENLSDQQKKIFEMKEIDGLEIGEIAVRLHMQDTAVRMNLSRARKEIRQQYIRIANDEK